MTNICQNAKDKLQKTTPNDHTKKLNETLRCEEVLQTNNFYGQNDNAYSVIEPYAMTLQNKSFSSNKQTITWV